MATTTNYSWTTPDDTDLVKDGAAAIRTLGSSIDTTVFNNAGAAVAKSTIDAKGDLLVGTADNTIDRLAVGTDGYTLVADSSTATGLAYAAPAGAPSFAGVQLTASSSGVQTIPNNTFTKLTFDVENYDVGSYAASSDTITIPSGKDGYYLVIGRAFWEDNATGLRQMAIYKNGAAVYQNNAVASTTYPTSMVQAVFSAVEDDTIELYVKHTKGSDANIYKSQTNDAGGSFSAAFLGA